MKVRTTFVAVLTTAAVGFVLPANGHAESKTVIESKDGQYKESYQDDDGTKSEYVIDEKSGTRVYKDSTGVEVKEQSKDGKFSQEYKDEDCKHSTSADYTGTGSKVVTRSDCD